MPDKEKTFSGSLVLDLRILITSRAHTIAHIFTLVCLRLAFICRLGQLYI